MKVIVNSQPFMSKVATKSMVGSDQSAFASRLMGVSNALAASLVIK